jgi:hypothetical protein
LEGQSRKEGGLPPFYTRDKLSLEMDGRLRWPPQVKGGKLKVTINSAATWTSDIPSTYGVLGIAIFYADKSIEIRLVLETIHVERLLGRLSDLPLQGIEGDAIKKEFLLGVFADGKIPVQGQHTLDEQYEHFKRGGQAQWDAFWGSSITRKGMAHIRFQLIDVFAKNLRETKDPNTLAVRRIYL